MGKNRQHENLTNLSELEVFVGFVSDSGVLLPSSKCTAHYFLSSSLITQHHILITTINRITSKSI